MTKETIFKYGANLLKLAIGENGFTLWLNGRWVLDASCISSDGMMTLDTERLKAFFKFWWEDKKRYVLKSKNQLE